MNGSLLLCIALAYFALGYWIYGGFLTRLFGIDPKRPTPAKTKYDGVDYVPCAKSVLFGHHFASIAGAGPIVGPIMAAYFGWLPALIWILVGCVFVGAVHDFAALFLSVRNGGRSIGYIIEKLLGFGGRQLFLIFCWACLILVVAIFGLMVAGTFVNSPAVATASLLFIFMAPIFGILTRKFISLRLGSIIFVPLVFIIVYYSVFIPADIASFFDLTVVETKYVWLAVLGVYVLLASVCPVHWLLQPRDYLSSYILYAMILVGFVGILCYQPSIQTSAFVGFSAPLANGQESNLFPALFILIACGACSGFHSLVASGTTSKQIHSEADIKLIGYGGMIVEGVLGVMSLIAVIYLNDADFTQIAKNPVGAFAHGIGTFAESIGIPKAFGSNFINLSISAFMLTSLDTATRLARFVWQEIFAPSYIEREKFKAHRFDSTLAPIPERSSFVKFITNSVVASIIVVGLSAYMVCSGEATSIWPIFGASNQLLAALSLLCVTLYLMNRRANFLVCLVPTILMLVMSFWGLIEIVHSSFVTSKWGLVGAGGFLIIMALLLILLSIIMVKRHAKGELNYQQDE